MTQPQQVQQPQPPRQWSDAIVGGTTYHLIAFYYDGKLTDWDKFYRFEEFGNFWICPQDLVLTINGVQGKFQTAEAAFQATKWWQYPNIRQAFEDAADGNAAYIEKGKAEKQHHADSNPTHGYAGLGQLGAMQAVLALKYAIPAMQSILLESGDAYLLEHNAATGRDSFWSDNNDGTGENHLGKMLMELRASFKGPGIPAGAGDVSAFTKQVQTV